MYSTFDSDITIFTHSYDPSSKLDVWTRHHVAGCSWYGGQKANVVSGGLATSDTYTVRIPKTECLDFAIHNSDIVVKGDLRASLKSKKDIPEGYQHFTVTGVYNNLRGPKALRHIRIEGK